MTETVEQRIAEIEARAVVMPDGMTRFSMPEPKGKAIRVKPFENTSGIYPVEFNVLLRCAQVEEKSPGGILKLPELVERERHGQTEGVLIAVSAMAFNEDIFPVGDARPEPGDRVAFAKHAGTFIKGKDGVEYRVIKDKDVVAILE